MNKAMLERYKAQNPTKYALKFGHLHLDELPNDTSAPKGETEGIKTEITIKKDLDMSFSEEKPVEPVVEKPKKVIKKKK